MRLRDWTYCLLFAGAAGAIPLVASLIVKFLPGSGGLSIWDDAAVMGFFLMLVLFYASPVLVLLALNLDLEPAARAKGDLTHLLTLKRRGSLPALTRRARGFRSGRSPQAAIRSLVGAASSPESPLDRLVSLKRYGA
jgi:hypothetical protein